MSIAQKINIGADIVKARVFGQKRPFSVNWSLTNRCNLSCSYCSIPDREGKELKTEQMLKLIDEMAQAGVIKLGLSGGEPLLRKDLNVIIDKAKEKNIFVSLTTNGTFAEKWLPTLRKVDCLLLSMDGGQEVHDLTGKEDVDKLIDCIRLLKAEGVKMAISAVLTRPSIQNLDYLFRLSEAYRIPVAFQPYSYLKFLSLAKTKNCDIAPTADETKAAAEKIISAKKSGALVLNSHSFLEFVAGRNHFDPAKCLAGERFCYIDANGDLYPCSPMTERMGAANVAEVGFQEAFNRIPEFSCGKGCTIACYIEYHYLFSLQWRFLNDLFRVYMQRKMS